MDTRVLAQWVLRAVPMWASALGFLAIVHVPILAGRWLLEGFPYNVSTAAAFGDLMILTYILIASEVLRRGEEIPRFFVEVWFDGMCIVAAAVAFTLGPEASQAMDKYHNAIVCPLLVYLVFAVLPVIGYRGRRGERIVALLCLFVWAGFFWFDFQNGLLAQRTWIEMHGLGCILTK